MFKGRIQSASRGARYFITSRFRKGPLLAARLLIDVSAQYADIGDERTAAAVILESEAIGRRFGDQELLGLLACMRTQDLAIAHDLAAARAQLALGMEKMQLLRHVAPGLRSECASAAAFVTQEDGDFAQAVTVLSGAVKYLDQSDLHGSSGYTSRRLSEPLRRFNFHTISKLAVPCPRLRWAGPARATPR